MNKKIIIAIFFTFIMVSGAGLVLFQNGNSHISVPQNPNVINSTTTNQCNVTVGATNSGLTVPLSNVGYSGSNGSSITTLSFDGDATVGSDGSVYGIGGTNNDLLIVNQTVTISNYFIPYGIDITNPNAVLTLNNDILDETYGHNGYNDGETGTNLIIENSKIHGGGHPYEEPICVANLTNTLTYAQVDINIMHASNDTFSYNTTIGEGNITTSHFSYNNMTADSYLTVHDSTITDSYLQGVNGSLNGDTIQHSTISFMPSYVKSDAFGNGQLGEQNTNLSYDRFIQYSGSQWDGLMLFDYSNMYNDYANFTIPSSDWSNTSVINNALTVQGYGNDVYNYRGSTNLNNSLYPVHISHNEFAGLDGMELYGTGNAYIENNIITEQFFWTAYIDMFNQYNEPLKNSIISNNTLYFYGNSAIEDNIDSIIGQGGGNTYITSGESGNLLSNVSIIYNTFQGVLGTVTENTNQHASFILGAYQYVNHNYFDVTSTFNSGASINAPEMEFDEFQTSGTSNVSYNKFYGLSSDAVAIAFIPVSSATTYGTEVLYANEYSGSSSPYQITAYTNYTIDAINKTNYQHLKLNGTVSMVSGNSPSGYTADSYLALIEYNVTFKSNIPYNYTWGVSATGKNQSSNVTTSTNIDTLYLAPENYTYTAYVSTPPSGIGIINPYINSINGNITDLDSNTIIYVNFTINTNVLKEHSLMVPIKLYNNGTSTIGEDTVFSINVNWEKYYPFVVGNVSDIRFYDQNDVYDVYEMSAWIQSGQSNLDNTSTVWINLGSNSISAGSSLTIYMNINITKDYFDSHWNTHGSTSTTTVNYQIETLDVSKIQFNETGLTVGTNWTVNLTNNIITENGTSITFLVNEGNYTYNVSVNNNPSFYKINPRNGTVFVNEFSTSYVNITFTNISYPVIFKESGLITNGSWTVWLNNTTSQRYLSGTGSEHVFYAINGSYAYSVEIPTYEGVTDFKVSPTSGTIDIVGNNTYDYNIAFTYSAYSVTFKQSGLSSGTWTVNIDNFTYTQSYSNNIVFWGNANQTYNATAKSSNPELVSQLSVYTVNLTSDQTVNVNFIITVTIVESGYTGTWHAIVNGVTYSTTTNTIVAKIAEGYTTITIYATDKYTVNPASMTYNYINKPTTLNVTITPTPTNYVTAIFGNLTMIYIIVFFGIMIAGAVIVYKIKRR